MINRWLNRYGTGNVPLIGVGMFIGGLLLILAGPGKFGSPAYAYLFDIAPRPVWAVALMVSGGMAALTAHPVAACLLCFVVAALASALIGAAIEVPNVPAFAPVGYGTIAACLFHGIARRGFGPPR